MRSCGGTRLGNMSHVRLSMCVFLWAMLYQQPAVVVVVAATTTSSGRGGASITIRRGVSPLVSMNGRNGPMAAFVPFANNRRAESVGQIPGNQAPQTPPQQQQQQQHDVYGPRYYARLPEQLQDLKGSVSPLLYPPPETSDETVQRPVRPQEEVPGNDGTAVVVMDDAESDEQLLSALNKLPMWKVALAGGITSIVGNGLMHPVDTIKTIQQSDGGLYLSFIEAGRLLFHQSGIGGFYKGLNIYATCEALAGCIKFAL